MMNSNSYAKQQQLPCDLRKSLPGYDAKTDQVFLPEDYIARPVDVLCGRGNKYAEHIGNKTFSRIIKDHIDTYMNSKTRFDRSLIVAAVSKHINEDIGLHFIKLDPVTKKRYIQLSSQEVNYKVGHALRDFIKFHCGHDLPPIYQKRKKPKQQQAAAADQTSLADVSAEQQTTKQPQQEQQEQEQQEQQQQQHSQADTTPPRTTQQQPELLAPDNPPSHPDDVNDNSDLLPSDYVPGQLDVLYYASKQSGSINRYAQKSQAKDFVHKLVWDNLDGYRNTESWLGRTLVVATVASRIQCDHGIQFLREIRHYKRKKKDVEVPQYPPQKTQLTKRYMALSSDEIHERIQDIFTQLLQEQEETSKQQRPAQPSLSNSNGQEPKRISDDEPERITI